MPGRKSGVVLGLGFLLISFCVQGASMASSQKNKLVRVEVANVVLVEGNPAVLLTDKEKKRYLLVFIDYFMASAIRMGMNGNAFTRPLTHDLIGILLQRLGAKVEKVVISDLKEKTFFAFITLRQGTQTEEIDLRPSDGLAIAVREKIPVFVATHMLRKINSDFKIPPFKTKPKTKKSGIKEGKKGST